jgi:hypothetical protein
MEKINPGMTEAAASEPNPISKRKPLTANTAVQALCNKTKMKLVRPMSQERCLCLCRARTPVCSVTMLLSSFFRGFICTFGRRAKMKRGYNEDHEIGNEIVRASTACPCQV